MLRYALLVLCLLAPSLLQDPASACMWDRDTLSHEAKDIPDVIQVITGRFERNPRLFYEMRLKRVAAELQGRPEKLEDYDDAGVACDRLGRGNEALAWMEKKRQELVRLKVHKSAGSEPWYRYYANCGTFQVHHWIRCGAIRKRIGEVKKARDLIASAIKINPNAHFGREKYQLQALQWIISPPVLGAGGCVELPNLLRVNYEMKSAHEAVKGLAGLIVLGNAWESVDVFNALAKAIQCDGARGSPAFLARLRACELVAQGKRSLIPGAPTGESLKKAIIGEGNMTHFLNKDKIKEVTGVYNSLRSEAEEWQARRMGYMIHQLKAGRHPDTDPQFWRDYRETAPPVIPDSPAEKTNNPTPLPALAAVLVCILLMVWRLRVRRMNAVS